MILDVNYGSKEKIKAVEGDNLERIETIYLKANGEIVNLQGLTCDMAYMDITNIGVGNVIENLTISNPTGGEVQLPINSEITKRNGYYNCELRLKNSSGLIKHTAYFELEISKNIFNQIAKPILNSSGFKKIQEILSSIDTYNKDLEDKLNTLSSLDSSNIEAKENIKNLQDNSNKATELNKTLESTNTVATSKTTELNNAVEESKKYIEALEPNKDIPGLKLEIQGMQEQLKEKQMLSYSGSNITCKNSLAGRTSNMKLYGKTLYKRKDGTYTDTWEEGCTLESCGEAEGNKISILTHGKNLFNPNLFRDYYNAFGVQVSFDNDIVTLNGTCTKEYNYLISLNNIKLFNADIGKTYYISYKKITGSVSGGFLFFSDGGVWNANGVPIVNNTPKNIKYYAPEGTVFNNFKIKIQIEEGGQTPFEPYQECKKEIQLQQPFMGLKDIQDTIEETDQGVVYTQNVGKIILKGSENWYNAEVNSEEYIVFYIPMKLGGMDGYSNLFINTTKTVYSPYNGEGFYPNNNYNVIYFRIKKSKLQTPDIEGFKKWLQANNIIVYYQLAEPIKTILKGIEETDVDTYNIITYFRFLTKIPGIMDFSIATNYGSLLNQHSQEINKIWDTINNILAPAIAEVAERSVKTSMNLLSLK